MPCCTYLGDRDHTKPTTDQELNELLAEVRAKTGDDWRIAETITHKRSWYGWFGRVQTFKDYELYSHVHGPEFQIINFYRPDRADNSLNFYNTAGYVAAYLYGMLAALSKEPATGREE